MTLSGTGNHSCADPEIALQVAGFADPGVDWSQSQVVLFGHQGDNCPNR